MYLANRDNMYNFLNEMFRAPFAGNNEHVPSRLMKTDIIENEEGYSISTELPGFSRENIQVELKEGYLTISANKTEETGKFLRRECFTGSCKRSFFVGEYLTENDIQAEFKDGVLKITFPKEPEPVKEEPKLITIQ